MSTPRTSLADGDEVIGSGEAASAYLSEAHGIDLAPSTLKTRVSQGRGPARRLIGDRVMFTKVGLDTYAAKLKARPNRKAWVTRRDELVKTRTAGPKEFVRERAEACA